MTNTQIKIRCPECGHLCEESDSYCESCGFPLTTQNSTSFSNPHDDSQKQSDTVPNQLPPQNLGYASYVASFNSFLNRISNSIWDKRTIKIICDILVITSIYQLISVYIIAFEPTYRSGSLFTRFFNRFIWLVDMIETHAPWISTLIIGIFELFFYTALRNMLKKHAISSTIAILIGVSLLSTFFNLFIGYSTMYILIAAVGGALCIEIGIKMNNNPQELFKSVGLVWIVCNGIMIIVGLYLSGEVADIDFLSDIEEITYSDFKQFRFTLITISIIIAICEIVIIKNTKKLLLSEFDDDEESFSESLD